MQIGTAMLKVEMIGKTNDWRSNVGGSTIEWRYALDHPMQPMRQQYIPGPLWAVDFVRDENNKPWAIDFNMAPGLSDIPQEIYDGALGADGLLGPLTKWFDLQ